MTRALDLHLPEPERRRAAGLATRWADLLYVPGPEFSSPLEPALFRSTYVIVPAEGRAVRVSSFVIPAFGGELCRLRLEPLMSFRAENLGSFFEPRRRGVVYAMSPDRKAGATQPAARPGWSYQGPSLQPRLERAARVRLVREHVSGGAGDSAFSWVADRGLVIAGADGQELLLLAAPDSSEHVILMTSLSFYRALVDPTAAEMPGATVSELLGYGDRASELRVQVEIAPL